VRLEERCLLAWTSLGPGPQTEGWFTWGFAPLNDWVPWQQNVAGRVADLAVHDDGNGNPVLLVGSAGGGVWKSTDFTGANPTWSPRSDLVGLSTPQTARGAGALNIGSIAVDPTNPNIVYAGTGEPHWTGTARGSCAPWTEATPGPSSPLVLRTFQMGSSST
jgi:hypothetical protein